ncbi:MAG: DNA mismatch repair protein MutS [Thermoanaerobaculia bacterium]|nr:DNA mismatch repair protein MutS [Thermoanaerobaculia bacterium]
MPGPAELTPMLRHYLELKAEHADALLFYRMGDFYELFFDDAVRAAALLELTLTARQRGTANEAPMCGVPHHALEGYVARLLRLGEKVAVCDQMEDPAQAKGLVRREVTRILTPGTLTETALLDGRESSYLAAVAWCGGRGAGAFLEVSTGELFFRRWASPEEARSDLDLTRPRELLLPPQPLPDDLAARAAREGLRITGVDAADWPSPAESAARLRDHFGVASLRAFGLDEGEPAAVAVAAALAYAQRMRRSRLAHIRSVTVRESGDALQLDATTLANLEVLRSARDGGRGATLLSVVDETATPAGARTLRDWLVRPLGDLAAIEARHEAVERLVAQAGGRGALRARLRELADLQRLAGRAAVGALTPREAAAIRDSLGVVPALFAELDRMASPALDSLCRDDALPALAAELDRWLVERPAPSPEDGPVIAEGLDAELDSLRSLAADSKRHILALEASERQRSGIPSLKIRYNQVFGYYIEVTKANQHLVPADYVRKQTLVNAERYVTPEIKDLEARILGAEERRVALEREHFEALRSRVAAAAEPLARLGRALARLDVLAGWAEVAARAGYVRPRLHTGPPSIRIAEGRHPVVERSVAGGFVPNDLELDGGSSQIVLLTGPNMGGKSTYLRQVALVVLLAQAGSFVPAKEAEIGLVDRIFTRVGASDDLARGESTFMVEMIETANILRHATPRSLVVLDEVGRGTATFDGLSLAWAIVEHLHEERRPLTLFATHYHELTELADLLPRVVNRTMAVKEWEERILFLRRVVPGAADKSYGLHVARLAGVPREVIDRAAEVLANLEAGEYDPSGRPRLAKGSLPAATQPEQLPLFTPPEQLVAGIVRDLDLERLTPIAALNLLASLKARLG